MLDLLRQAVSHGLIRNIDYFLARQILHMDGRNQPNIPLLTALVSARIGEGDVCLDLQAIAGTDIRAKEGNPFVLSIPSLDELISAMKDCALVGTPGQQTPLILDDAHRLYLGRYWWFEQQVAEALLLRAVNVDRDELDLSLLKDSLQRMFPAEGDAIDWQMIAAAIALLRRFAVISGGPGTGKTHTVTSILALLVEQSAGKPLTIALAAPTGKAAARLTESIRKARSQINCSDEIKAQIPEEAVTLHRLLGVRPGKVEPRHHAENPLRINVLVVDEASMIDLPMMARLLSALPPHARLILLGDKDQLASVEAGSVFADISARSEASSYSEAIAGQLKVCTGMQLPAGETTGSLGDSVALLRKSYRFEGDTGIGALAKAINLGTGVLEILKNGADGVSYRTLREAEIEKAISSLAVDAYANCFASQSPWEAIEKFNAFRILCAVRRGPAGVEQVNRTVEAALRARGLIQEQGAHYKGRPVMVTRNDYSLGLFNGDIGIIWPDPAANGALRACFILPDASMRRVPPSRLPEHETAFAMTVHKSQGSEFDCVLMLLPLEQNEVLTRELLYTGITRAKREVEVWGSDEIVSHCVQTKIKRASGLAEKLNNPPAI
jgi:exodeoxyribonuclease V alpha subunit